MRRNFRRLSGVVLAASLMAVLALALLLTLTPTPEAKAGLGFNDALDNSSLVHPALPVDEIQARRVITPTMEGNPNLNDNDHLAGVTGLEIQARRAISIP